MKETIRLHPATLPPMRMSHSREEIETMHEEKEQQKKPDSLEEIVRRVPANDHYSNRPMAIGSWRSTIRFLVGLLAVIAWIALLVFFVSRESNANALTVHDWERSGYARGEQTLTFVSAPEENAGIRHAQRPSR